MLKKIVIAGSAAAVVLGAGTAALAASGSASSSPSAGSSSSAAAGTGAAKAKAGHAKRSELRRALHATWVTKGKGSTSYVTHDAIRGQVTAVSATSITVKAADNVSETFAVNSTTKVHTRAAGKGVAGTMSQLKAGDKVLVTGTGTSSLTATQVVGGSK